MKAREQGTYLDSQEMNDGKRDESKRKDNDDLWKFHTKKQKKKERKSYGN